MQSIPPVCYSGDEQPATSYACVGRTWTCIDRYVRGLIPPAHISRDRVNIPDVRFSQRISHQQCSAAFASSAPRQLAEPPVCATQGALWDAGAGASLRAAAWAGMRHRHSVVSEECDGPRQHESSASGYFHSHADATLQGCDCGIR